MIRDRIRSRYTINSEADRRMENIKGFGKCITGISRYDEDTVNDLSDERIDLLEKKVKDKARYLKTKYSQDIKNIEKYFSEIKKNANLLNYMEDKFIASDIHEYPLGVPVLIAYDYLNDFLGLAIINDDGLIVLGYDFYTSWDYDQCIDKYDTALDALKDHKELYDEDVYHKFLMYMYNLLNIAEREIPKFIKKFYDTLDSLEDDAIESSFRKRR